MNRFIKFLAWLPELEKMATVLKTECSNSDYKIHTILAEYRDGKGKQQFYKCFKFVLRQFTGLLDKNGKEIYEGDIVSLVPLDGPERTLNGVVTWVEALALFQIECYNYDGSFSVYSKQVDGKNVNREVIGNIYENPNLLEK